MPNTSIFIISDNAILRQTMAEFVSLLKEVNVVEMTDSIHPQLSFVNKTSLRQLVLLDVDNGGLTLVKHLRNDFPAAKIVVLTSYDLDIYRQAALQSGANECLLKIDLATKLHPLIRAYAQAQYDSQTCLAA